MTSQKYVNLISLDNTKALSSQRYPVTSHQGEGLGAITLR